MIIPVQNWKKSWPIKAVQHLFTNRISECMQLTYTCAKLASSTIPGYAFPSYSMQTYLPMQVLVQHLLSLLLDVRHLLYGLLNTLVVLNYVQFECEVWFSWHG